VSAAECEHKWERVHHYGDHTGGNRELHYCPTGYDICYECLAVHSTPPDDDICRKWAEE